MLMYHKVNDLPGNPLTMPVSIFDEQMDQLRELDYTVVDLDAVLDHYVDGKPLPERAVLITFDDGYHDNLDNAAGVLRKYGYPAVLFVPIGYLDDRHPLPHEEHLAAQGILNRTIEWDELAELEQRGDPHRVARHLASPARRSRGRRGRARDRALEAPAGGAARPAGARVLVRQRLGGALQARPPLASCARRATTSRSPPSPARTRSDRPAAAAPLQRRAVLRRARSSSCSRARAT